MPQMGIVNYFQIIEALDHDIFQPFILNFNLISVRLGLEKFIASVKTLMGDSYIFYPVLE